MSQKVLVVKSSSRGTNNHSNNLVDTLVSKFSNAEIVTRDVSKGLPLVEFMTVPKVQSSSLQEYSLKN